MTFLGLASWHLLCISIVALQALVIGHKDSIRHLPRSRKRKYVFIQLLLRFTPVSRSTNASSGSGWRIKLPISYGLVEMRLFLMSKTQRMQHQIRTHSKVCLIASAAPLYVSKSVHSYSRGERRAEERPRTRTSFLPLLSDVGTHSAGYSGQGCPSR